jgi:hypothetical protein
VLERGNIAVEMFELELDLVVQGLPGRKRGRAPSEETHMFSLVPQTMDDGAIGVRNSMVLVANARLCIDGTPGVADSNRRLEWWIQIYSHLQ